MTDLELTDELTFRACFMVDRYSFYLSLGKFVSVTNSFYENNSTIKLCCERNNFVVDDKKRGNSAKNCPFSWFYFLQSTLVLL